MTKKPKAKSTAKTKTNKSTSKRLRVTSTGKVMRRVSFGRHLRSKKSSKQKRGYGRHLVVTNKKIAMRVKRLLALA